MILCFFSLITYCISFCVWIQEQESRNLSTIRSETAKAVVIMILFLPFMALRMSRHSEINDRHNDIKSTPIYKRVTGKF